MSMAKIQRLIRRRKINNLQIGRIKRTKKVINKSINLLLLELELRRFSIIKEMKKTINRMR